MVVEVSAEGLGINAQIPSAQGLNKNPRVSKSFNSPAGVAIHCAQARDGSAAKKYMDFAELTTPMIYEFVEQILVHAPDRSSGKWTQAVEIFLKFIGKFEAPMPEPAAEELAGQEKQQEQQSQIGTIETTGRLVTCRPPFYCAKMEGTQ